MNSLFKYPRTYHLPWSLGITSDDKVLQDICCFEGKEIVVLEKMDGENCNLYNNAIHARSLDSRNHPSRDWIKKFHSEIKHNIPEGFRICGENMFAKHSIFYEDLESYFLCFSIWDKEMCLSWNDTLEYARMLSITPVKELYRGKWCVDTIKEIGSELDESRQEGYVVRNVEEFNYNEFSKNVAKYVRKNHVDTDEHWMYSAIVPNKLKND